MTATCELAGGSRKLLVHPRMIAATCAGSVLLAFLSYRAGLAAIPPGCLRGSLLHALPALVCFPAFAVVLMAAMGGVFYRLRPRPSVAELVWAQAIGMALGHAALFGVYAAVYAAADVPPACASPSLAELAVIALCQLVHVVQMVRRAIRVTAVFQEEV
jgi:hypothetical protein